MSQRFFVDYPIILGEITLDGPEAHHLINVMRAKRGDELILFDGSGAEFNGEITDLSRKKLVVNVTESHEINRELPLHLEIAAALPKGDRQRVLVEKLVEIGVSKFVPLQTARGVARAETKTIGRLERMVIEASKQCQRNVLMEISQEIRCCDYFKTPPENSHRLIATPQVDSIPLGRIVTNQPTFCAIGPEGGFTEDELRKASESGWKTVDLGKRILRTETAAILMASYLATNSP